MKLQTRRRIFYVLVLLFVVVGAVVVMYAEGWRLDLSTMEARKAGGIYVRSFPENASITVSGEAVPNQAGFLSPGTFISGLFPKTYTVSLSAPGYDGWTETPTVAPSLVTELKYAVLVPKSAVNVATSGPVAAFFEASGDIIAQSATGTITWRGRAIGNGTIISHSTELKTMIFRTPNPRAGAAYFLYDFTAATTTNLSAVFQKDGVMSGTSPNVFIDPYDGTGIFVQTATKIVRVDADTHRATPVETAPMGTAIEPSIALSPSTMAWARFDPATDASRIIIYDTFSGDTVDSSLVVPGKVLQLAWLNSGTLGVLEADNVLYRYAVSTEQLSALADDVIQFSPAPDGSSVAVLEHHAIEVFAFGTQEYERFAPPQVAEIGGLTWYGDDEHLFVRYPDRVAFLDLADAALKNLIAVSATAPGSTSQYDAGENALYLIDQGQQLLRFDLPH